MLRRFPKSKHGSKARPDSHSGEFTADFRHEFDVETREMLRGRFLWFDGLVGLLWLLMLGFGVYRVTGGDSFNLGGGFLHVEMGKVARSQPLEIARAIASPVFELVAVTVYLAAFLAVRRGRFADRDLVRLTFALVMVDGVLRIVMHHMRVDGGRARGRDVRARAGVRVPAWSPRRAARADAATDRVELSFECLCRRTRPWGPIDRGGVLVVRGACPVCSSRGSSTLGEWKGTRHGSCSGVTASCGASWWTRGESTRRCSRRP